MKLKFEGNIKNIKLISLFLFITCWSLYAQVSTDSHNPKVSIISSNAYYLGTFISESSDKSIPGSKISLPVVTKTKSFVFDFKLKVIVKDKGETLVPLYVKIISPENISKTFELIEDISIVDLNKVYDYNFEVSFDKPVTGWFWVELVPYDDLRAPKENNQVLILDKTKVYFKM